MIFFRRILTKILVTEKVTATLRIIFSVTKYILQCTSRLLPKKNSIAIAIVYYDSLMVFSATIYNSKKTIVKLFIYKFQGSPKLKVRSPGYEMLGALVKK